MNKNTGNSDRMIRVGIAIIAVVGAFFAGFGSVLGIVLLVVAGIMLATAAVGFCPIYRVFGLSTCSVPQNTERQPVASTK